VLPDDLWHCKHPVNFQGPKGSRARAMLAVVCKNYSFARSAARVRPRRDKALVNSILDAATSTIIDQHRPCKGSKLMLDGSSPSWPWHCDGHSAVIAKAPCLQRKSFLCYNSDDVSIEWAQAFALLLDRLTYP
jgi:hypothetical protein